MGLAALKSRCQQVYVPSKSFRGESTSLSFPASRRSLHSLVHGPFLSSKPTTGQVFARSYSSDFCFHLPQLRTLVITPKAPSIISTQENLIRNFNFIYNLNSTWPCNLTHSQVLGIRMKAFWVVHYYACHILFKSNSALAGVAQ